MLEFTLTPEDHVAFQLWGLERSARVEAATRRALRLLSVELLVGLLIPPAFLVATGRVDGPEFVTVLAACVAVWLLLRPLIATVHRALLRARVGRRTRARLPRAAGTIATRLWIDDTGITVASGATSTHLAWSALHRVDETPHFVYLTRTDQRVVIVPRRAGPGQVAALAAQAQARLAWAGTPAPSPGFPGTVTAPTESAADTSSDPAAAVGWVPPAGVVPLSAFGDASAQPAEPAPTVPGASVVAGGVAGEPPAAPALSFVLTVDDITDAILGQPAVRERIERAARKTASLRRAKKLPATFLLLLAASLIGLRIQPFAATLLAAALTAAVGLLGWAEAGRRGRGLAPRAVDATARNELSRHGDRRQLWVDEQGVTVADAVRTSRTFWAKVDLVETDQNVVLLLSNAVVPVPRRLGAPADALLAYVRAHARDRTTR